MMPSYYIFHVLAIQLQTLWADTLSPLGGSLYFHCLPGTHLLYV